MSGRAVKVLCVVVLVLVAAGCNMRVTDGNGESGFPSISGDGRYLAYTSAASDLVPGDTNGVVDVFVLDRDTGQTVRITDGNVGSGAPEIAADGSSVAYSSAASNLVSGDTNGFADVFVWNATTHETTRVTAGNGASGSPSISGDGRYVAFSSAASDLVPGDTNTLTDVFLWDATTSTTRRVTDGISPPINHFGIGSSGSPSISADGTKIAFVRVGPERASFTNLIQLDVYLWDATTDITTNISNGDRRRSFMPDISGDGSKIVYTSNEGINGGAVDRNIFLWEAATGSITRLTNVRYDHWTLDPISELPTISDDGTHVAFTSNANTLTPDSQITVWKDVFLIDLVAGTTERLTNGSYHSEGNAAISSDGRYVAFDSSAPDLVGSDGNGEIKDVFLWDTLHFEE